MYHIMSLREALSNKLSNSPTYCPHLAFDVKLIIYKLRCKPEIIFGSFEMGGVRERNQLDIMGKVITTLYSRNYYPLF